MTLHQYFDEFCKSVEVEPGYGITGQVAAELAAGYEIGLTIDQMRQFLARRTEITSVAAALKSPNLSAQGIERILEARAAGAVYPKDVLAHAFRPDEVHPKFHAAAFGETDV